MGAAAREAERGPLMLEGAQLTLRSALRDLDEGVRALLGDGSARLALVSELLGRDGGVDGPRPRDRVARGRRRGPPRPRRGSARLFVVR